MSECRPLVRRHHGCQNGISVSSLMLCVQLMMILIKVSDISNEARPMEVAEPWLDLLLQEFYNQVDDLPRKTLCRGTGTSELRHIFLLLSE